MGTKAKKYTLAWPLNGEQLGSIDEMLDDLYKRVSFALAGSLPNANALDEGDLLYFDGDTLEGITAAPVGAALLSAGLLTTPTWGKIGLTTHVSGTLPLGSGGTGATAFTAGAIPFSDGTTLVESTFLRWDNAAWKLHLSSTTGADNPVISLRPGTTASPFLLRTNAASGVLELTRGSWDVALQLSGTTDGSNYAGFRSANNMEFRGAGTGTIVFTPANGGGEGAVIFGKRLSDSHTAVGTRTEFWPRTAQTSPVLLVKAPGGATTEWSVLKSGVQILGGDETLKPATGTNVAIFVDGTVPATMGLNTAGLYANDVGGIVKMFVIDEDGTTGEIAMLSDLASAGGEWSVLTNGDVANPELIFADGDVIMLES